MTRRVSPHTVGPELLVDAARDGLARLEIRVGREGVDRVSVAFLDVDDVDPVQRSTVGRLSAPLRVEIRPVESYVAVVYGRDRRLELCDVRLCCC
jgi:hypothetical protein